MEAIMIYGQMEKSQIKYLGIPEVNELLAKSIVREAERNPGEEKR